MNLLAMFQDIPEAPGAGAAMAGGAIGGLIGLVIAVVMVASLWKVFTKAGEPGWAAIVPIYNIITMLKIAGKPIWFIVLFFLPVANFIAVILVAIGIAQRFGKGAGFGIGLALVPIVFYPMLAFGDAQYQGGGAGAARPAMA